jgi:predicted O-linked N-acetylglucosamine transferase (SPINDLY family)
MTSKNASQKQQLILQKAIALQESGQLVKAIHTYKKLLKLTPKDPQLLNTLGIIALQLENFKEGLNWLEQSLKISPNQPNTLSNCGYALQELKRYEKALAYHDRALALQPNYVDAHYNRGLVLQALKRNEEALLSFDTTLTLHPKDADAYYNRCISLKGLKRYDEALISIDKVITLQPDYADAYCNRGTVLNALKHYDDALSSHDKALSLRYNYHEAHSNRASTLYNLKRLDEALESCNQAIIINPDYAEAHSNRGVILTGLRQFDDALASYDRAIAIKPDYADAYSNRGVALKELKRLDEALASYDRAILLKPDINFILGHSLHTKMHLCIWDELPKYLNELTNKIDNNEKVSDPFPVLALIDDPNIQRKTAEIFAKEIYPVSHVLPKIDLYPHHPKIRIGYFSADFHNHATMHLMAELFEYHDKKQFELIAFSFGPDEPDEWRQRALLCFDQFVDVRFNSDREIALLARGMQIDIAIDLKGFTQDRRTGIFAERCAPIQVNYLGYPGTMAVDYMDYLIADRTLIPEDKQQHYSEKIVYLPNSYQVNVSKRTVTETTLTRQELGLPDTGFVFCCFNNNYKITPSTFAAWMRILSAVDGSVLWLFEGNNSTVKNLKKEAVKIGINEDRLIFAKQMPIENHLNRIQLADLFIDTLPYNAHTTASDALRMGLPVLTCIGNSFASRVSASLLNAVNLPELITSSQAEYEGLAIELANHPDKLNTLKIKLLHNLPTSPLYDSRLFTMHIESAYLTIYERQQNGLVPDHIYVDNKI